MCKQEYLTKINDTKFYELQSWIENNINIGETKSDFYKVKVDSRYQLLEPSADRISNDIKELRERIYLGDYYMCTLCEDRRMEGEEITAIFPSKLNKKDYDVFDHISEYHPSLVGHRKFSKQENSKRNIENQSCVECGSMMFFQDLRNNDLVETVEL